MAAGRLVRDDPWRGFESLFAGAFDEDPLPEDDPDPEGGAALRRSRGEHKVATLTKNRGRMHTKGRAKGNCTNWNIKTVICRSWHHSVRRQWKAMLKNSQMVVTVGTEDLAKHRPPCTNIGKSSWKSHRRLRYHKRRW